MSFFEDYIKWIDEPKKPGYCPCCGVIQDGNHSHDPECIWADEETEKQEQLDLETQRNTGNDTIR